MALQQCLDPSEQLAEIILDMLSVLQSCAKVLHHIVLQDVLKKLVNHQHGPQESEATVGS